VVFEQRWAWSQRQVNCTSLPTHRKKDRTVVVTAKAINSITITATSATTVTVEPVELVELEPVELVELVISVVKKVALWLETSDDTPFSAVTVMLYCISGCRPRGNTS
jgi:hypothetical protein